MYMVLFNRHHQPKPLHPRTQHARSLFYILYCVCAGVIRPPRMHFIVLYCIVYTYVHTYIHTYVRTYIAYGARAAGQISAQLSPARAAPAKNGRAQSRRRGSKKKKKRKEKKRLKNRRNGRGRGGGKGRAKEKEEEGEPVNVVGKDTCDTLVVWCGDGVEVEKGWSMTLHPPPSAKKKKNC